MSDPMSRFFAAEEERRASTSPFLRVHYGLNIRELELEEAQEAVRCHRNLGRSDLKPVGYCHDCGRSVHGRMLFCAECSRRRRNRTQRDYDRRNYTDVKGRKYRYNHGKKCAECGAPITNRATRCRTCNSAKLMRQVRRG